MEYILDLLYIYIAVYSVYFLALALRNLNDKPFQIEKRYSKYEEKEHLAVVIYSHNNKQTLENLINQLKQQDYPVDSFRVFAILDNCNDGSEGLFERERFVSPIVFQETQGKDRAVSLLTEQLAADQWIDSYIFIDATRGITNEFLSTINSGLVKNSVLCGETVILPGNSDIIDQIKSVYLKYHMNFIKKARSLFGLANLADSGLFVIRKDILDKIGKIEFKNIDSELR